MFVRQILRCFASNVDKVRMNDTIWLEVHTKYLQRIYDRMISELTWRRYNVCSLEEKEVKIKDVQRK